MLTEAIVGWLVQLLGDRTLRVVSKRIFGPPERRVLAEAMDEAIGSFVAPLAADQREHVARALVERFEAPPMEVNDGPDERSSVREALVENIREQLRPLADPHITGSGRSYFEQMGLDPARALSMVPDLFIAAIQRAATMNAGLAPLAAQLNADAVLAEVRALRASGTDGSAGGGVLALARALEAVPSLADEAGRTLVIDQLRPDISATVRYNARTRLHVLNLAQTCDDHPGGVRELIDVLTFVEGDSLPMRRAREIAAPWLRNGSA
ncbi:effector-associated domain 2-containing protein [Actinoallomurus acanthiterrae]